MSGLTWLDSMGIVEGHKKELAPPKRGKLSARLALIKEAAGVVCTATAGRHKAVPANFHLIVKNTQTRVSYN